MSLHDTLDLGLTALTPGRARAIVGAPLGTERGWALMEDGSCRPMYGDPPRVGADATGASINVVDAVATTASMVITGCIIAVPVGGVMYLAGKEETGKKVAKYGAVGAVTTFFGTIALGVGAYMVAGMVNPHGHA